MREIKFRAWDKKIKKMYCVHEIEWDAIHNLFRLDIFADGNYISISDNYELMQYTGLKDKNGKEIYEGDIIKDIDNYVYDIYYGKHGNWLMRMISPNYPNSPIKFLWERYKKVKVIGDIYENPELLKK